MAIGKYHITCPVWKGGEAWDWCEKNIGKHGEEWSYNLPFFYFENENDFLAFTLKYGHREHNSTND